MPVSTRKTVARKQFNAFLATCPTRQVMETIGDTWAGLIVTRTVTRTVTPTVPLRVDYELTALGQSLVPIMRALKDWSEHNMTAIGKARDTFDARRKL
jgi:Predicted transcriptional regulators